MPVWEFTQDVGLWMKSFCLHKTAFFPKPKLITTVYIHFKKKLDLLSDNTKLGVDPNHYLLYMCLLERSEPGRCTWLLS